MADLAWIAWVLAGIGLITGYVYFRLNRKVKRLEWTVVLDQSLLALPSSAALKGKVSVNIGSKTLREPRALTLKIKNTGNVGLSTKSMYRPFELVVAEESDVQTLTVTRTRVSDGEAEQLTSTAQLDARIIPLPETLLNPGDEVRCTLLIDGPRGGISLKGEAEDFVITGRREPSQENLRERERFLSSAALMATAVALLGSLTGLFGSLFGS
ncbi:hypothetical protein [Geodermatophilus amargosae]|uniref:hypothetical protein n=1 Tax=Geodermatophilus amargosae TaxID=1296565 RepID=UPI0034DF2F5F